MSQDSSPPEDLRQIVIDLDRKRALLSTINDFALKLLGLSSESGLVWYVAREVVGRLGFEDCVIYLIDRERNLLCQVAAIGMKNPERNEIVNALEIPIGRGITGHVAATRNPLVVDDLEQDGRYIPDVEPARSEICVPLIIDGEAVGVIDCEDPRPGHFNEEHLETLTTIAAMTSARLKLIKETQRAEDRASELHRSEDRFRDMAANVPGIVYQFKIDGDGTVSFPFVSPAIDAILGLDAGEVMADPRLWFAVVHPDDRPGLDKSIADSRANLAPWHWEGRMIRASGEVRWFQGDSTPRRLANDSILWNGLVLDVTERKTAERALKASEELFSRAFHASPALFAIVRPEDGKIYDVNDTWLTTLGHSYEDALTHSALELGIWTDPTQRASFVERLLRERSIRGVEAQFRTKEGKELDVLVSAEYVEIGGEPRMLVVTLDITTMKQAEEQLHQAQKMEAVGHLTGGVAHDFNNLLAIIQGNAELIASNHRNVDRAVQAILRASSRGAELTQRLLAFSRRQPLQPRSISVSHLIADMSDLLDRTLGETIETKINAEPDLWDVMADPGQVESALLNLAINARDAIRGSGTLTIECANERLDETYVARNPEILAGDYVIVAVTDDGAGMSGEVRKHAFEPFFTTKEVGKGSGLGLSMVYGFAKQSKGHVTIYSEEGQGTTVKLYLPRATQAAATTAADTSQDAPMGSGETILVIEDDSAVRELVATTLGGLGYRVVDVPEAASAWRILEREERVDLVLSDVVLPAGTSGRDFAEQAKEHYPDLRIIFMSGYPAGSTMHTSLMRADEILLNKPFRKHQLALAVRAALDQHPG